MKRLLASAAVIFALGASPALAVNDPHVPGDECSASGQAVGHPAFENQQDNPQGANPPFSSNNPGKSTGAKAGLHQQGTAHCTNAG
jgi:hypothetical protein